MNNKMKLPIRIRMRYETTTMQHYNAATGTGSDTGNTKTQVIPNISHPRSTIISTYDNGQYRE